jgi:hypothetical protein
MPEGIFQSENQRQFGTDNNQINLLIFGQRDQGRDVIILDIYIFAYLGGATVAWRTDDSFHFGVLGKFPAQCVLSTTGPDNQYFHEFPFDVYGMFPM